MTEVFEALGTCYLALVRAMVGSAPAASGRDQECVWARTPVPVSDMNRVMLPRLPNAAPDLEMRVVDIEGRFEDLPHSWWLDPGSRPGALEASLRERSPRAIGGAVPAMALELTGPPPDEPVAGIEVELAAGRHALIAAGDLAARGFEVAPDDKPGFEPLFARIALDPRSPVRVAVGRLGGRPAATALGCLAGDMLGIYSVATLPDARRRGLGRAVTLAVLQDGAERGARLAVLESSAEGLGVYHGLGFREAGRFRVVSVPGRG